MAEAQARGVYLVRVITDDRKHQIWAVAAPREEAVDLVLDAVAEGWAASLLTSKLKPISSIDCGLSDSNAMPERI